MSSPQMIKMFGLSLTIGPFAVEARQRCATGHGRRWCPVLGARTTDARLVYRHHDELSAHTGGSRIREMHLGGRVSHYCAEPPVTCINVSRPSCANSSSQRTPKNDGSGYHKDRRRHYRKYLLGYPIPP